MCTIVHCDTIIGYFIINGKTYTPKTSKRLNNLFPATLTALVHQEEDEEGVVVAEALAEMVTKGDVEVPRVVRMDLHANEHSAAAREIGFLTRDHYIVEAKDTRAQLQRFCTNLTF